MTTKLEVDADAFRANDIPVGDTAVVCLLTAQAGAEDGRFAASWDIRAKDGTGDYISVADKHTLDQQETLAVLGAHRRLDEYGAQGPDTPDYDDWKWLEELVGGEPEPRAREAFRDGFAAAATGNVVSTPEPESRPRQPDNSQQDSPPPDSGGLSRVVLDLSAPQQRQLYQAVAQEMGNPKLADKSELEHLPGLLDAGERLFGLVTGRCTHTTFNGISLVALTDRRIIVINERWMTGVRHKVLSLRGIDSVNYETGMILADVTLVKGGEFIEIRKISKDTVANFARTIQQLLAGNVDETVEATAPEVPTKRERSGGQVRPASGGRAAGGARSSAPVTNRGPAPRQETPSNNSSGFGGYFRRTAGVIGAIILLPAVVIFLPAMVVAPFLEDVEATAVEAIGGIICTLIPTGFGAALVWYGFGDVLPFGNSGGSEGEDDQLPDHEKEILRVARTTGGRVTPALVAAETTYSIEECSKRLEELTTKGYVRMDIDDDGNVVYAFAGLE